MRSFSFFLTKNINMCLVLFLIQVRGMFNDSRVLTDVEEQPATTKKRIMFNQTLVRRKQRNIRRRLMAGRSSFVLISSFCFLTEMMLGKHGGGTG